MTDLLRTPLYPLYADTPGVRCIDFGGWELPVQFDGIQKEHEAVRQRAGLFDVSHMGEFLVTGPGAASFVQRMTTNDVTRLVDGQAQYSLLCYPDGGVVDDLLVYRLEADTFMLVVNASNIAKDYAWLEQHANGEAAIADISDETALLALQGPNATAILAAAAAELKADELKPFHFVRNAQLFGARCIVSRTGYTGEDGFEIYAPAADTHLVWRGLMSAGEPFGLVPVGLGARDTLRFEAKLPLYGQELSATISPLEAGLGMFVKLAKGDFVGREALQRQKDAGVPRKLVGIEMLDRGIPRAHYLVYADDAGEQAIGEVTTGTQSPTLKRNLGLALLQTSYAELGTEVWVDIRGKRLKAAVVQVPFYKRTPSPQRSERP